MEATAPLPGKSPVAGGSPAGETPPTIICGGRCGCGSCCWGGAMWPLKTRKQYANKFAIITGNKTPTSMLTKRHHHSPQNAIIIARKTPSSLPAKRQYQCAHNTLPPFLHWTPLLWEGKKRNLKYYIKKRHTKKTIYPNGCRVAVTLDRQIIESTK